MSRSRLVVQLFRLSPLPRDATRLNLKPFNRVANSESEPGKFSTNPFAVLVQMSCGQCFISAVARNFDARSSLETRVDPLKKF